MTLPLTILGPGTLGLSLARHAASLGVPVRVLGRNSTHAEAAIARLTRRVPGLTIEAFNDLSTALAGAGAFLEALPENLAIKAEAWREIDRVAPREMLCLSASSAISLAELRIAAGGVRPILGFHLFVPVHRQRIVELVREASTDAGLLQQGKALAAVLHLQVANVRDQPGQAATRMALIQGLEAIRLLEEGMATVTDLDALMVHGYGHPCGPLELTDRIGLDLRLTLADYLFAHTRDTKFQAPELLKAMVARGEMGRKSGKGFYRWTPEGVRQ